MDGPTTTIFGGTGFVGNRIARALVASGGRVRIAVRHPRRPDWATSAHRVELVTADIRNETSVARAVFGADAVVNAVSCFVESRRHGTFESIHIHGAARLARAAKAAHVQRFVLVSGMGVDPTSPSPYVRARMRGEELTRAAFPGALVARPSVIFGPGDAFLGALARTSRLPMVPLFGNGDTRLQPVHVDDVALAVLRMLSGAGGKRKVFELGGAGIYTYREVVEQVLATLDRKRRLVPVPFGVWRLLAMMLKVLPNPPLTADQVMLMQRDNVASQAFGTFADLGVKQRALADCLAQCLGPPVA
jgi:NADH dehydrogenase